MPISKKKKELSKVNKRVSLKVHKLFFVINFLNREDNILIESLCNNLTSFSFEWNRVVRRFIRKKSKEYFIYDVRTNEYRFPIKTIKYFMYALSANGFNKDDISITVVNDYVHTDIDIDINPKYKLRDYQDRCVDIIINGNEPIYLIDSKTGTGKGLISAASIVKMKKRALILVLPKYVDKWISDIKEYTTITDSDVYVVQGSKSLIDLMLMPDIPYKIIVLSLRTFSNYLADYETINGEFNYPVKPQDFMECIRTNVLFNDETHQHFHSLSHAMLYLNAEHAICATATFDSNEKTIKKLYNTIIPAECRISNLTQPKPYVEGICVRYELRLSSRIKFKRKKGYSHTLFEQSIMRNYMLLYCYEEMILKYVKREFIDRKMSGDKCLVFFATVDMCTHFSKVLKHEYPELNIMRYCEDDSYDNILSGDITCSTVLSSGTALDIPNLITVIQTISIYSLQSNLQSFGRLREIKDRVTKFIWFWTSDIINQRKMNQERYNLLQHSMKDYIEEVYPKTLSC